jgi:hypothetical protein
MNLFILDESPIYAAMSYCDKHVPKLIVECFQMLGSAQRRHGAEDADMPLTSKGTPLKGGYHNHPATRWVGRTRENYFWTCFHAAMLCEEYEKRFNKTHACAEGIEHLYMMADRIPEGELTEFAQCMPDEYKVEGDAVSAYRAYYKGEKARFAQWTKGRIAPYWWQNDWIYGVEYPLA